jgi:hypothetical protein
MRRSLANFSRAAAYIQVVGALADRGIKRRSVLLGESNPRVIDGENSSAGIDHRDMRV